MHGDYILGMEAAKRDIQSVNAARRNKLSNEERDSIFKNCVKNAQKVLKKPRNNNDISPIRFVTEIMGFKKLVDSQCLFHSTTKNGKEGIQSSQSGKAILPPRK